MTFVIGLSLSSGYRYGFVVTTLYFVLLIIFAAGLVVALDKDFRRKLRRWTMCSRRKGAEETKSSSDRSDVTRADMSTNDVERGMRMSFNASFVRGMPSPLRQESTEGKTEVGSQPGQDHVPELNLSMCVSITSINSCIPYLTLVYTVLAVVESSIYCVSR